MQVARSDHRAVRLWVIVVVVAVLAAIVWLRPGDPATAPTATAPPASASAVPGGAPPIGAGSAAPGVAPLVIPGLADLPRDQAIASVKEALADYLQFAEFPPWSRPADDSQKHLREWNQLPPVGQAFATDKKGGPISAELSLDRMFAGPGEAITATVRVWRGAHDAAKREPVEATAVGEVQVWREGANGSDPEEPGWPSVATIPFVATKDGFVAKIVPSSIAALTKAPADARFVAWVTAGDHKFPFSSPFRYASSAALVVLEGHSDKIVDGSLQVTLAVDVKKLGPVLVQATLYDATGTTPIAVYDDYYRPAQLGPQELSITFFGRALREQGVDGPYSVRALHGHVRVPDADPPEVFWAHDAPIPTGTYKAEDFAGGEWDSPEKQAKINQYKTLIADLEAKAL